MKLKLTTTELTGLILNHIDILNERFLDREFRMYYTVEDITDRHHKVSLQYRYNDSEEWKAVTSPTPKKQLLEAVKLFDCGSYMYQEATDPIFNK
jgi:hypothetical protein